MTSAEKVDELRQAITAAVAGLDRDSEIGEQVFALLGGWQMIPGFVRRRITGAIAEQLPLELLSDAATLDDILGLLAGLALELRTDGAFGDPSDSYEPGFTAMRARAADLLGQVRSLGA